MKYLLILFCLKNILQISLCDLDSQWDDFKVKFNKSYFRNDYLIRKGIFASNLEYIEQHNEQFASGLKSFELGVNQFADLTDEEYEMEMNLYETASESCGLSNIAISNMTSNIVLPDKVNWIDFGYRNPVLNQGKCGSCYAFAAIDAVEGHYYIKNKKLIRLSQQEIVDCGGKSFTGINGCRGGDRGQTLEYIKKKGITYDSYYPYQGKDDECKNLIENPRINISDYQMIQIDNEGALKEAVATIGLVSVGIYASLPSFKLYKSGVYYDENCIIQLNHGVSLVGYGKENDQEYWLVKNSWGSDWGDKGYIKMARNRKSHCGIARKAIYPII